MTTHAVQFGKHASHNGLPHSHGGSGSLTIPRSQAHPHRSPNAPRAQKLGNRFVMVKPKGSGDEQHDALVKNAEKWVAQTFYGEMIKQMRNSPFKSKLMSGGRGGEAFGEMFDQKLAEKMAKGSGHKLVDAMVNAIEHPRAAEARKAYGGGTQVAAPRKVTRPEPSPTLQIKQEEGMQ